MSTIIIKLTKEQIIELTPIWDELDETDGGAVLAQVTQMNGMACKVIPASLVSSIRDATGTTKENGWQE